MPSSAQDKSLRNNQALGKVYIPHSILEKTIREVLAPEKNPAIERIDTFQFDPLNRLIQLSFTASLPESLMKTMKNDSNNQFKLHDLDIILKFPKFNTVITKYILFEIIKVSIDEQEITQVLPMVNNLISNLLERTAIIKYIGNKSVEKTAQSLIESEHIKFYDNKLRIKLDLSMFSQLVPYKELHNLMLWQFRPANFNNSKAFLIEFGLGKPGEKWIKNTTESEKETQRIAEEKNKSIIAGIVNENSYETFLNTELTNQLSFLNLNDLKGQRRSEVENYQNKLLRDYRDSMTLANEEFLINPEKYHRNFLENSKHQLSTFLGKLNRKLSIEERMATGGKKDNSRPIVIKKISEKTINQVAKYYKDFNYMGESLFSQIDIALAPQSSGLIVRGILNVDLNNFYKNLEKTEAEKQQQWRIVKDFTGRGVSFELGTEFFMQNKGLLGLNLTYLNLMQGTPMSLTIKDDSYFGNGIFNFFKIFLANTMSSLIFDIGGDIEADDKKNVSDEVRTKKLFAALEKQKNQYGKLSGGLKEIIELDLNANPFLNEGKKLAKEKSQIFIKDFLSHNNEEDLIYLKLDPKPFAPKILESDNNFQIWNFESRFEDQHNKNYLEVALGEENRSHYYLNQLTERRNEFFSTPLGSILEGTFENTSPVDLQMKLNLNEFKRSVNQILRDFSNLKNKESDRELAKKKESKHILINSIALSSTRNDRLSLNLSLTEKNKIRRSNLNPKIWFGGDRYIISERTINISAEVKLSISSRFDFPKDAFAGEILFGSEFLELSLKDITLKAQKTKIWEKVLISIVNNINLDEPGFINKTVISLLGKYLNPKGQLNGNLRLGEAKLPINKILKILTYEDRILLHPNPRLSTPALETRLIANGEFKNNEIGLHFNSKDNEFQIDLQTVSGFSTFSKQRILKEIKRLDNLFKPYEEASGAEELARLLSTANLHDKVLANHDIDGPSPSTYSLLKFILSENWDSLGPIFGKVDFQNYIPGKANTHVNNFNRAKNLSTSGVELSYLYALTKKLYRKVQNLNKKVNDILGNENYIYRRDFEKFERFLSESLMIPTKEAYLGKFSKNNHMIIKKGPTDWNYKHYSDALLGNTIFSQ